jgi:CTP:molybdopterin cytidylyltransferase MocA
VIAAIVLAAGEGSRFGGIKQLHPIDGRPMLEHVLAAVEASGVRQRLVVLGAHADAILATVPLHGALPVIADDWQAGQAASLLSALATLSEETTAVLVVLGDGPGLAAEAVRRLADAAPGARAADYGHGRSHPVVLPRAVWPQLATSGETPGRSVAVRLVDCSDLPPPGDLDRPPPKA